ncbi:hypothetical protein HYN48_07260 [Flavobacterium magnum]|uniref:Fibronectin type-III domain-containing protein n=1 Tax=Flavobacterium magnum TaxID=2162713 RepID=A0A2S0RFM9_9FLAO|nr:fibronectin type III domain-containing protein [Flavobacterium magnum]AWA29891.1 hypothetical protein HYN48_07260 [Flavobacterium magnum]
MKSKITQFLLFAFLSFNFTVSAQCWQSVSTGNGHTGAIKPDGSLWTFGFNAKGQLGINETSDYRTPQRVSGGWKAVSMSGNASLGLKTNGNICYWGDINGTTYLTPQTIGSATDWKSISNGATHFAAIKNDGTLWLWGINTSGQLGDGTTTASVNPKKLGTATNWKMVQCGSSFTTALKTDGTLWAWGSNSIGGFGNGTTTNSSVPVQIGTATDWASISRIAETTLAIKTDGTLWAWGRNSFGQVGDGTFVTRTTPVQIGTSTWKSVCAGGINSFALKTDGTLWAWGNGGDGQLGNNAFGDVYSPVQIGTGNDWTALTSSNTHTLGLKADGSLYGWGSNYSGEIAITPGGFEVYVPTTVYCMPGCTLSTQHSPVSTFIPALTGAPEPIFTDAAGIYSRFQFENSQQYIFTSSIPTDYITLSESVNGVDVYATGPSPFTWSPGTFTTTNNRIRVAVHSGSACGTDTTQRTLSVTATCGKPKNLTSVAGANTATLNWELQGYEPASWDIYFSRTNAAPTATTIGTTVTVAGNLRTYPIAQLNGQTTYYYWIKSTCGANKSAWISGGSFTTLGTQYCTSGSQAPTTNFTPSCTGGQETINTNAWDGEYATVNVIANKLYTFKTSAADYVTIVSTDGSFVYAAGQNPVSWQSPFSGTIRYFIYAGASCGTGNVNRTRYIICENPCGNATDVTASNVTFNSVSLSWTAPATAPAQGYQYYYSTANTAPTAATVPSGSTAAGAVTANVSNLVSGTTYFYWVRTKCSATSLGAWIPGGSFTTPEPCARPTALTITDITPSSATLSWTAASTPPAAGYEIYYSTSIIGPPTINAVTSGLSVSITGLAENTTYYYWVRSNCGTMQGSWIGGSFTTLRRLLCNSSPYFLYPQATFTPACSGSDEVIAADSFAGQYSNVSISANTRYTFRSSVATDYITVTNAEGTAIYASGFSPVTWLSDMNFGVARYYLHTNTSCGAQNVARTKSITCSPQQILPDSSGLCWKSVTAGYSTSASIRPDGTLWTWGNGGTGSLGTGNGAYLGNPTMVGTAAWSMVSMGSDSLSDNYTTGIQSDGTLWAWGGNFSGQLGTGGSVSDYTYAPTQVGSEANWKWVNSGKTHTAAIKTNGTLWAWGLNTYGQVGDGSTTTRVTPVQVGTAADWKTVVCGADFTTAIKTNGTLWAWGRNLNGVFGNGTTTNSAVPVQIGTATDWKSISRAGSTTLALKTDGTLWAWGINDKGQVGNGTTATQITPVQIGTATWQSISAGIKHSLAISTDGTLWAWGDNSYGQLGDNTIVNKSIPTQVGVNNNWTSIGTGFTHSMATTSDASLYSWGENAYGQLGLNNPGNTNRVPAYVTCVSGCTKASNGLYPTATFTPAYTNAAEAISTFCKTGEYSNVNILANRSYIFTSSVATDYITITDASGNQIYASGFTPFTWYSADKTGVVRYYLHTNTLCYSDFTTRTRSITTVDPTVSCSAVANLTSSLPANNAVKVNWTVVSGNPAGFEICFSLTNTPPTETSNYFTVPGNLRNYTKTDLAGNTLYYYWIRSNCGTSKSVWTAGGSFTTLGTTDCLSGTINSPGEFTPAYSGTTEFVSGLSSSGFTTGKYVNVYVLPNKVLTFSSSSSRVITITSPDKVTVYARGIGSLTWKSENVTGIVRVYLHEDSTCSTVQNSASLYLTAEAACLAVPANVTVSNFVANTATLSWTDPANEGSYDYVYSTSPVAPGYAYSSSFRYSSGNPVVLEPLLPSTTYYYWVRSRCGSYAFSDWAAGSFTTQAVFLCTNGPLSAAVPNFTPACTGSQELLSGSTSAAIYNNINVIPYKQYTFSTSRATDYITITNADGTALIARGTASVTWISGMTGVVRFYVHANAACGEDGLSRSKYVRCSNPPCDAPPTTVATNITANAATIEVTAPATPSTYGYEYYLSTSPNTPSSSVTVSGTIPAGSLSKEITGLNRGTNYYYWVRTVCYPGVTSNWNSGSFMTPCDAPSAVTVSNVGTTTATVSWTTPALAPTVGYQVYVTTSTAVPGTMTITNTTTNNFRNFTALLDGTTYYVWVRSICTNSGVWVSGGSFTTHAMGCRSGNIFPSTTFTPACDTGSQIIATNAWAGEYTNVNVLPDRQYVFGSSVSTDFITITNLDGGVVYAYGTTPLAWSSGAGVESNLIRFYIHTNDYCGTENVNRVRTIACQAPGSCAAPQGLSAGELKSESARISWNIPLFPPSNGYQFYVATENIAPSASFPTTDNTAGENSFVVTGLTPSTAYFYWVRSVCASGPGAWVAGGSFMTAAPGCTNGGLFPTETFTPLRTGEPEVITNTAFAGSYSNVTMLLSRDYTFSSSVATDYITVTSADGSEILAYGITPVNFHSYVDGGTVRVYFHTNSACGTENIGRVRTVTAYPDVPCDAPTNIRTSLLTSEMGRIAWDGTHWAEVYFSTENIAPLDSDPVNATRLAYDSTSYSGLLPNTTYYYWIRSYCEVNWSQWVAGSFTTIPAVNPGCNGAPFGLWPAATFTPVCSQSPELIAPDSWPGEFSNVVVLDQKKYTFASSVSTDYITITNEDGSVLLASGVTPVVWQSGSYSGLIRYHLNTNAACGVEQVSRSRYITCQVDCVITASESVTACESYDWHGENYHDSGDYTYQSTDESGCIHIETLHLTINRNTTTSLDATACDSYVWNGVTYTETGDYTYESTNASGCINTANLHLQINHSTATSEEVTACDSYEWNGQNYTESGDYTYTGTNASGCPNVATLHLTINHSTATSEEATACDSYDWHGQRYRESGDYTFESINAAGCTHTATLHLTINPSTTSEETATACDSYEWNGREYTESGDYTYEGVNAFGCTHTSTLHLTVNRSTTTDETATACGSYLWHGVTYTNSGDYTYSGTNATGCTETGTLHLTVSHTAAPTATAQSFCSGSISSLTAAGTDIKWYASPTGGTALGADTALEMGTYYASQTLGGCESDRTAVSVTVQVGMPSAASPQTFVCGARRTNLSATGTTLRWYTTPSGGTAMASSDLLASGTYYVTQTIDGCQSSRRAVEVIVNTIAAPVSNDQTHCYNATVANLTASGTDIRWYATAAGGTALSTGTQLTAGTYYASQKTGSCESARTAVLVTLSGPALPDAPQAQAYNCGSRRTSLVATGTGLKWYTSPMGGTPMLSSAQLVTGPYYVSQTIDGCEGPRREVSVTILYPSAPTASTQFFCTAATVANLYATGSGIKWYASETDTTPLASTTPLVTATYYASQTNSMMCESARTAVEVITGGAPMPEAPSPQTFVCGTRRPSLAATGSGLAWYTVPSGGTALSSTAVLSTGTYYVSQTVSGCVSGRRAVSVIITNPSAPAATAQVLCSGSTVANLAAAGTSLKWYTSQAGGTALATGTILSGGTYYVSQSVGGCESDRTTVSVTINTVAMPDAPSPQVFSCNVKRPALTATGTNLLWYTVATGGSALPSTAQLATGTYYVSQTIDGCTSARRAVSVSVNATAPPAVSDQSLCQGKLVSDLVATGTALRWYASASGGTSLAGSSQLTAGTYYVSQTLNGCESLRAAANVTLISCMVRMPEMVQQETLSQEAVAAGYGIRIFPNPTSSLLNIRSDGDFRAEHVVILDSAGRVVLEQKGTEVIDVSRFAAGVYILRATSGERQYQAKFVKE